MGFTKKQMDKKLDDIIKFAEIGDYIDQVVKTYSSGMFARLAFSCAINVEPEILIVDEILSVGDMRFQAKCFNKFKEFKEQGVTILYVGHDVGMMRTFCDRCMWINNGKLVAEGDPTFITAQFTEFMYLDDTSDFTLYQKFSEEKSAELDEKNNAEVIDDTQKEDGKKEEVICTEEVAVKPVISEKSKFSDCLAHWGTNVGMVTSIRMLGEDGKEISVYDKHCLHLSKEEVEAKLAAGEPHVIRFNMPTEGTTTFHDDIYGDITVQNDELDDLILIKSDGYPTYNFANVIDDHLMNITHVVRGNEYLSSSPKYNRIYEAFGWEIPTYVHCPLITNEEHKKLSKRSGHSSYEDLLEQGFLTEAIVNYVALLGWCPQDNREIFSLEELVKEFDYHHMSKSPAVFDMTKLKWMNGEYIKAMDFDKFYEMALPYIQSVIKKDLDLKKIAQMVKTRIEVFPDIPDLIDFFEAVPEYDVAMYTHKKMKTNPEISLEVLNKIIPVLEAHEDYTNDALYELLCGFAKENGYKNGQILWPIRTALSGKQMTPAGATEILEVLGKDESIIRLKAAVEKLS